MTDYWTEEGYPVPPWWKRAAGRMVSCSVSALALGFVLGWLSAGLTQTGATQPQPLQPPLAGAAPTPIPEAVAAPMGDEEGDQFHVAGAGKKGRVPPPENVVVK